MELGSIYYDDGDDGNIRGTDVAWLRYTCTKMKQ